MKPWIVQCTQCGLKGQSGIRMKRCPQCRFDGVYVYSSSEVHSIQGKLPEPEGRVTLQGDEAEEPPRGKPRKFWVLMVLNILTMGAYLIYWEYKALREVAQYYGYRNLWEVQTASMAGMMGLMLPVSIPLITPVSMIADHTYIYMESKKLTAAMHRDGLTPKTKPGKFLASLLFLDAMVIAIVGFIGIEILLVAIGKAATEYFYDLPPWLEYSGYIIFGATLLLTLIAASLVAAGYRKLQQDINTIWKHAENHPQNPQ